jgi:hypothetical protein
MTAPDYPGGGEFFVAVPLETEDHAATVEVAIKMVQVQFLGPVNCITTTLTRREAQAVALAMIDASHQTKEE